MAQGFAPQNGFELPEGRWLNGLAAGVNYTYGSGFSAAGTTQSGATQLPSLLRLIEVDTVGASSGVALPPAVAGSEVSVYNSTSTTLTVYPSIANNPKTGVQDTINTTASSITVGAHGHGFYFCPKTGNWAG